MIPESLCLYARQIFFMLWPTMTNSVTKEVVCQIFRLLTNQGMEYVHVLFLSSLNISSILPIFHPEFGRFMLEATPGKPWGIGFKDLLDVEPNMRLR
jgi:hypothetical protein